MNGNKVHSQGNIPFAWENKPGVSKVTPRDHSPVHEDHHHLQEEEQMMMEKLPPPPCPPAPENGRISIHRDLQDIPLPPCAFQPPNLRSSSRRGLRKQDDPFLIAYKECTKSSRKSKFLPEVFRKDDDSTVHDDHSNSHHHLGFGLKKNKGILSCKRSCSVIEGNTVRVSQLPISRSERERERIKGLEA